MNHSHKGKDNIILSGLILDFLAKICKLVGSCDNLIVTHALKIVQYLDKFGWIG